MADFVVFNDVNWKPPIASKLLGMPEVKLSVKFAGDDLGEMDKKQRAAFDKAFKDFDAAFDKLGKQKIKDIQSAVQWTEERIEKKPTKKEREEVVDTANKLLKQAFATFENQIKKLADDCYKAAVEKSYKVMKRKLQKAKAKAVCRIAVISLLTLTAAGLAIAATVATGGAVAPLVAGAVLTGAKAIHSVYKEIDGGWASTANQIKTIAKDVATLEKAAKTLDDQRERAAAGRDGALDSLKKVAALFSGKLVSVEKHVGQMEKFVVAVRVKLKEQRRSLEELKKKVAEANDSKLEKEVKGLEYDIKKAEDLLSEIDNVKKAAEDARRKFDDEESVSFGPFQSALKKVAEAGPYLQKLGTGVKSVYTAAGKLAKAAG